MNQTTQITRSTRPTRTARLVWLLAAIVLIGLLVRLYTGSSMGGYESDQQYFVMWMETVQKVGLGQAYAVNEEINYPPVLLVLLRGYWAVMDVLGIPIEKGTLSMKFPMLLFDAAAMAASLWITRSKPAMTRLLVVALFALSPAFVLDGVIWGQVDMLHSMLMVATILLLSKRPGWAGAVFAVALLTKFQTVVLAPVIGIYVLREWLGSRRNARPLLHTAAGFSVVYGAALAYFALNGTLGPMLKGSYFSAVGFYPYVTLNAMNIWYYWLGTSPYLEDSTLLAPGFTVRMAGFLLLALAAVMTAIYLLASRQPVRERLLKAAVMMNFAFFMLPTEIHERYCMPAIVLAAVTLMEDMRWRWAALLLTLTGFLNMLMPFTGVNPYMGMGLVWLNVYVLFRLFATGFKEAEIPERVAGWLR